MPAIAIRPIRQSNMSITSANTAVVISPLSMFTSTIGTIVSMLLRTVVHTPES